MHSRFCVLLPAPSAAALSALPYSAHAQMECVGFSPAGVVVAGVAAVALTKVGRVPGTRAGLKRRSQSAQEAPAPVPVAKAMGHARPACAEGDMRAVSEVSGEKKGAHARRKRMTEATTPAEKPMPLRVLENECLEWRGGGGGDARLHEEVGD
jgi:hypothetical protein